jgi:hypothetical protein
LLVLALLCARQAVAQPAPAAAGGPQPASAPAAGSPSSLEAQESLIKEGVEARKAGDDAGAVALFERANALGESPRALAQLGLAEQALGRWVEAEEHLTRALAFSNHPWISANASVLRESVGAVAQHLGSLSVEANVAQAELLVDGVSSGKLPLAKPLRLMAGAYTIEIKRAGYYPKTRRVVIDAGGMATESFSLQPEQAAPASVAPSSTVAGPRAATPAPAPPPAIAKQAPGTRYGTWKWVALAGSGALAVTAGVLFGLREKNVHEYNSDASCPGTSADQQPSNCDDRIAAGKLFGVLGGVSVGGAAVAGVAAGTLFALDGPRAAQVGAFPGFGLTWHERF